MFTTFLGFFLPLSLTPFLIFSTHTMTDAALARLPEPEIMLAAFAVGKSLSHVLISPTLVMRQVTVAMVESQVAYGTVRAVLRAVTALVLLAMAIIAFSPISNWVLGQVMGLGNGPVFVAAQRGFKLMVFISVASFYRNVRQGIAIRLGYTRLVFVATLIRVFVIGAVLFVTVRTHIMSGIVVATAVWVGGMAFEGVILALIIAIRHGNTFGSTTLIARRAGTIEQDERLGQRDVLRFFVPLISMPALGMLILPLINGNLARLPNPSAGIAAFAVAQGIAAFIASPTLMLYQTVLAYYRDEPGRATALLRFCLVVGAVLSGAFALFALSPLGGWFAVTVMGLAPAVADSMQVALGIFALMPLVSAWRDYSWGVLIHRRRSWAIGIGRVCNLIAVWFVMMIGLPLVRAGTLPAPALGAMAYICGDIAEAIAGTVQTGGRASC